MQATVEDLNDYMMIHGNETLGKFNYNDKLIKAIQEINEIDNCPVTELKMSYMTKHNMKKKAFQFINDYYKVMNVGYLPDSRVKRILKRARVKDVHEAVDIYNESAKYISPFKLPIYYNLDKIFDGRLITQVIYTEAQDKSYLKDTKLFFTGVELPKCITDIATSSYIHEITHALIETYKGNTKEYYNAEVLPIFNELMYAYLNNEDMYKVLLHNRINSIYYYFYSISQYNEGNTNICEGKEYTEFNYHADIKYIISTLKAIQLLESFINDKYPTASYVVHQAGRVIEGHRTVEEFLEDVGVTYDSCTTSEHVEKVLTR